MNVTFSVRDCGLIWNIDVISLTSVIYQVYSQDNLEAWHDEGQSKKNWIKLSTANLARTKAIRLTIIGEENDGKIVSGNAFIALNKSTAYVLKKEDFSFIQQPPELQIITVAHQVVAKLKQIYQ